MGSSSSAFAYRISLFEEAGISDPQNNFPKTWEELFAVGKTLKEMGKPFGQALGQSPGDPPSFAYPYMWGYGAMEVEEDGTTVAINKPEFVEALQTFIQVWKDAYDETGLSWDDGANNRAFLSDQISGTLNGSSVYLAAVGCQGGRIDPRLRSPRRSRRHLARRLSGGRPGGSTSSAAAPSGHELLAELGSRGRVPGALLLAGGLHPLAGGAGRLHHPDGPGYADLEIYTGDPIWRRTRRSRTYSRNKGYAGPANQKAAESSSPYIVINTFAQAIQTGDAAGAVEQAEAQLAAHLRRVVDLVYRPDDRSRIVWSGHRSSECRRGGLLPRSSP